MSLSLARPRPAPLVPIPATEGYWQGVFRRFRKDKVAVAAALVLLAIVLVALLAPYVAPADPFRTSMLRRLRPIGTPGFPLGSDELGRDMLTRLIYGARLSLFIGVTPVVIAFAVGSAIGVFAGSASGMSCARSAEPTPSAPTTTLAAAAPPSENRSRSPAGPPLSTATAALP